MFPRLSRFALTGALSAGLLAAATAAPPAQAATGVVTACVKKKTGEVRVLSAKKASKKCKKGWKKVSWNQQGAQGDKGAAGPNLLVKDATGKTLGKLLGVLPVELTLFQVEIDGGAYSYLPNGSVFPGSPLSGPSPMVFTDNTCSGTAFLTLSAALADLFTQSANGPSRIVYRASSPSLGPVRAWKFSTTVMDVAAQPLYELDSSGVCGPSDPATFTGKLGALVPTTAPPDVPGPLTVG